MPRVAPHTPLYITDPWGEVWRVYDAVRPAPSSRRALLVPAPPGTPVRWFVNVAGERFAAGLPPDDPADRSPATLARQVRQAIRHGPIKRWGRETHEQYVNRQQANIDRHPEVFPPGTPWWRDGCAGPSRAV